MSISELLTFDNPVLRAYLFYVPLLTIKVLLVPPLIVRYRLSKRIFSSQEDTKLLKGSRCITNDPDIERVRRAHLNDLESIPIFMVVALCYLLTNPNPLLAINLMRIFTITRYLHTFVYAVYVIPQPARAIAFAIGHTITMFMAIKTAFTFY